MHAHWMDLTMFWLSTARSSNVLSSVILPSSLRMVVCASCTTAKYASSTPYDARTGSMTCANKAQCAGMIHKACTCWENNILDAACFLP